MLHINVGFKPVACQCRTKAGDDERQLEQAVRVAVNLALDETPALVQQALGGRGLPRVRPTGALGAAPRAVQGEN